MDKSYKIDCAFEVHPSFEKLNLKFDNLTFIKGNTFYELYGDLFVEGEVFNKQIAIRATVYGIEDGIMQEAVEYVDLNRIVDLKTFRMFLGTENDYYDRIKSIKIYLEAENVKPVPAKELKKKIERILQFEEKLGITIKKMGVKVERSSIKIMGDILIDNDDDYEGIILSATLYDKDGDIMDSNGVEIDYGAFLGFETFAIDFDGIDVEEIDKITLYPKVIK